MNKQLKLLTTLIVVVVVALIGFSAATYTVREDEVVVVHRLGKVDRVIINPMDKELVVTGFATQPEINPGIFTKKGLNYKLPFVESVEKYSSKYLTYVSTPTTINTFDRRRIDLSIYAQYKIVNPALFNMTMGLQNNAVRLMDDRVYPAVIQTANTLRFNEFFERTKVSVALDGKRDELNNILATQFGLFIIDIGIYRKNFPQANIASIEEKMTQEIQKESEKLMAEGDSLLRQSMAETDRVRQETVAFAIEESATIKAEADARSTAIYEEALKVDIEFYRFINRMDAYRGLRDTTVFMDKDNDFIRYLNQH